MKVPVQKGSQKHLSRALSRTVMFTKAPQSQGSQSGAAWPPGDIEVSGDTFDCHAWGRVGKGVLLALSVWGQDAGDTLVCRKPLGEGLGPDAGRSVTLGTQTALPQTCICFHQLERPLCCSLGVRSCPGTV